MKPSDAQPLFKDHSSQSLNKYRSESIEQRALRIGKQLLVPTLPKKKDQKNLFTITTNSSHHSQKSHEVRPEEQLQRRLRMLEFELKRKLNEDSLLRNLFKTRQTHEMNHIDLYLQLRNLEDKYTELAQHEQQSRKNAVECEQLLKDQEQTHLQNMEQLNACISQKQEEWAKQKSRLADQADKYKMQSEEAKFLIQELKKKNNELIKKNKQLTEQLAIEKQSKNLELLKLESEYQKEAEEMKQALSKLTQQNTELSYQKEHYDSEKCTFECQLSKLRDRNQELELQICQLQQMTHSIARKEEQLRKEQREKYTGYYDKLRKEHEIQVQQLFKEQEQALTRVKKESFELAELNAALMESIKKLQRQVIDRNKQFQELEKIVKQLEQRIQVLVAENEKEIETNAKLSRQSKELKFQRQEIYQQLEKTKFELKDQAKTEQKLQAKVKALEEHNEQLTRKGEELKVAAEHSQGYRKLNDKIYNQNYKTLGRLIEISHKIKQHIEETPATEADYHDLLAREPNEQSLSDVVSNLAELLSYVLRWSQLLKKQRDELARQRNIENRQICSILQHCKNILHTEETIAMWSRYILHLRERKAVNSEQNKERVDVYHQLIEHLINFHTNQYYSSDQQKPRFSKDSLDSTHLLRDYASKKKDSKPIERQSSCKGLLKKHRIETEPPSYDLPLKRKLAVEDEDKENINLNANKEQQQPPRKYANRYAQEVRQRICQKYPSRRRQQSQGLRSEVEKKYFRS